MDWRRTDGLRRMLKAASFKKLACMINADTEAIIHVSGSLQIRRILHEMITCTAVGHRASRRCTLVREDKVRVESWKLCLFEWSDLSAVRLRCTGDHQHKRLRAARSVGVRDVVRSKNPALYSLFAAHGLRSSTELYVSIAASPHTSL